jgi:hypothetical protein
MSLLEAISPTARELFALEKNHFVITTPDGQIARLASTKRKPKLPAGFKIRGPFKYKPKTL